MNIGQLLSNNSMVNLLKSQVQSQTETQDLESKVKSFQSALENAQKSQDTKEAKDDKKLKQACTDLEAVFLTLMFKSMRETVPENTLTQNSYGRDMFQSMLDEEYSKAMADTQTTGLAGLMYQQLKYNMSLAQSNQQESTGTSAADPIE